MIHTFFKNKIPTKEPKSAKIAYTVSLQQKISSQSVTASKTLSYRLEIERLSQRFFQLWRKKDLRINGNKNISKVERAYLNASSPLDELSFSIGRNGKVQEMHKYRDILRKWEIQKGILLQNYEGRAISNLVKATQKSLQNPENAMQAINRDLVFQHISQTKLNDQLIYNGSDKDYIIYEGLIDTLPLAFKRTQRLSEKDKKLLLTTDCKLNHNQLDSDRAMDYFNGKTDLFNPDSLQATVQGHWEINPETAWIQKGTMTHTVWLENQAYKKDFILNLTQDS